MEFIVEKIRNGEFKNIVVCSGAGVSTNSGIPDYRSDDGLFAQFSEIYPGYEPSEIFSRSFRDNNPDIIENEEYINFINLITKADPTPSHNLCKWFHDKGWLKRVYTQNIDRLYLKTGLPKNKVVEFHGYIHKNDDGSIEDKVVLYGDDIPDHIENYIVDDFIKNYEEDNSSVDLMIVMGTSLQVAPFCAIPNIVNKSCTRLLVDINPENAYNNLYNKQVNIGYYTSSYDHIKTWTTFGHNSNKRKVSLTPQWNKNNGKWKKQYIIESDCDVFSELIMK